jgi:homogentisate 1,2-dioxygenase
LPQGRNSPQVVAHGLYAEQVSGTAFTAPRHQNRRSWLYRIRPAAMHGTFAFAHAGFHNDFDTGPVTPDQLRWNPLPLPDAPTDFIDGLSPMAGNGAASAGVGIGIHLYAANRDMQGRFFYDADGELLIVPQQGRLHIETELGVLDVEPQEIAVIPRGIRFRWHCRMARRAAMCARTSARSCAFRTWGRSAATAWPIRAISSPRMRRSRMSKALRADREIPGPPVARRHRPFAAGRGRLARQPRAVQVRPAPFNTIGSISYDHPDPSIFLVLTSPSDSPGVGNMDFVIFPPRVLVAQDTFRPPWFHRNIASEFMGLVHGVYDAKAEGFAPGGCSLHNCMTGHGPDAATFDKASAADTSKPDYIDGTMAFMFETRSVIRPTRQALDAAHRQRDYQACWAGLRHFVAPQGCIATAFALP